MEIIALVRGEMANMMNYITILRGIPLPYPHIRNGKKVDGTFMLGVSPIMPVGIRFPKDQLNTVLGILKPEGKDNDHVFDASWKTKFLKMQMRKSLNLKPLPKSWDKGKGAYPELLENCWCESHLIGIKEDGYKADGITELC